MKAVSLWNPWAAAIAAGIKKIETRSWTTSYRGPLAIHAAKRKMTPDEWALCGRFPSLGNISDTYGCVVATCTLVDTLTPRQHDAFAAIDAPTPRQQDLLDLIREYRHLHGIAPTLRELGDGMGCCMRKAVLA